MAEQLLSSHQVSSLLDQINGEAVPTSVRVNAAFDADLPAKAGVQHNHSAVSTLASLNGDASYGKVDVFGSEGGDFSGAQPATPGDGNLRGVSSSGRCSA